MTYHIPIPPKDQNMFGCWNRRSVSSEAYRTPSIQAAKEQLILTVSFLIGEVERCDGYPPSAVSASLTNCQNALLLLVQVERQLKQGERHMSSIIGRVPPSYAELHLEKTQQGVLDRRLINRATIGDTAGFQDKDWERLKAIRPDLAPADAGDNQ